MDEAFDRIGLYSASVATLDLPKENVAEQIAEGVSEVTRIPIVDNALTYNRSTEKQGMLTTLQRFENLKSAISMQTKLDLAGMELLIIDDVMTSGATANESARVLYGAGAKTVIVATIARGVGIS